LSRTLLVFGTALVALMAGALLFVAQRASDMQPEAASAAPEEAPPMREGVYPAFSLPDETGEIRDFAEWSGKHRIVNFWATWCAPCRREIPLLKDFQDQHGNAGIQVIGVAVDEPDEVAVYAEAARFNYPIMVGQEDAMAIAETSGIEMIGLPFTMIVAADGELLNAHLGEIHQEELDQIAGILARLDRGEIDKAAAIEALKSL